MPHTRARLAIARALAVVVLAAAACDRRDAPARIDTAGGTATGAPPTGAPVPATPSILGSMLVVPGDTSDMGVVIFPSAPDPQAVASAPVMLLAPNGDRSRGHASLVMTDSQVCGEAPLVRIQDSVGTAWSVGILAASVSPISTDSIETMPRADSSRLAAELARLASSLPMDDTSRFKGLSFVVVTARRFDHDARRIVVAHLVRRVPHEAAPAEEHTFLVAERDTAAARPEYTLEYHLRSEGTEETAESVELLAAVRARDAVWLILSRDNTARTIYELLERARQGVWRSRWSRALSC